jgi:hypothetical protein
VLAGAVLAGFVVGEGWTAGVVFLLDDPHAETPTATVKMIPAAAVILRIPGRPRIICLLSWVADRSCRRYGVRGMQAKWIAQPVADR